MSIIFISRGPPGSWLAVCIAYLTPLFLGVDCCELPVEIMNYSPLLCSMDHPKFIVQNQMVDQGSYRHEKYLNLEGFLEKSLKIKSAVTSTGKSPKSLEKSLNSTIFCRT